MMTLEGKGTISVLGWEGVAGIQHQKGGLGSERLPSSITPTGRSWPGLCYPESRSSGRAPEEPSKPRIV